MGFTLPGAPLTWPPVGESCAISGATGSGLRYGASGVNPTNFTVSHEYAVMQGYLTAAKMSTDGKYLAVSSSWLDSMYLYQLDRETDSMSLKWERQIARNSEGGIFGSVFDFDHENSRLAIGWGHMGTHTTGRVEVFDIATLTRIGLPIEGAVDEQIASGGNHMAIALSRNRLCANNQQHGRHVACFELIEGCTDDQSVCWTPMNTLLAAEASEFGRHVAMSDDTRTLLISGNNLWHYELSDLHQYELVEELHMNGGWELNPSVSSGFQSSDFMDERFALSKDGLHLGAWYNTWYFQIDGGALPWTPTPTDACGTSRIKAGSVEFFKFNPSTRRYAFSKRFLGGVSQMQVGYTVQFSDTGEHVYIGNFRSTGSNVSTNLYGQKWHSKWHSPPTNLMNDVAVYTYPGLEMLCQPIEVERGVSYSTSIYTTNDSTTPNILLLYENWKNRIYTGGIQRSEARFLETACPTEAVTCAASRTIDPDSRVYAQRTSRLIDGTWTMKSPIEDARAYMALQPSQGTPTHYTMSELVAASMRLDVSLGANSKLPLLVFVLGDDGPYSASSTIYDIVNDLNAMHTSQYRSFGGASCHAERASGPVSLCVGASCTASDGRHVHTLVDLIGCNGAGTGDMSKVVRAIVAMTDESPVGADYDITFEAIDAGCLFGATYEAAEHDTNTAASTVSGDPHIVLAHGGRADFRGEPDSYFNFVSHRYASLNVRIEASQFRLGGVAVQGTFITEAHMSTPRINVSYFAGELNDNLYSWSMVRGTCDGASFTLGPKGRKICGDVSVVNDYSSSEWNTSDWMFRVRPNRVYDHIGGVTRRIDLAIQKRTADAHNGFAHGVVGQSFDGDNRARQGEMDKYPASGTYKTIAQAEGAIEGTYKHYRMQSSYSTAFAYSRYARAVPMPSHVSGVPEQKKDSRTQA